MNDYVPPCSPSPRGLPGEHAVGTGFCAPRPVQAKEGSMRIEEQLVDLMKQQMAFSSRLTLRSIVDDATRLTKCARQKIYTHFNETLQESGVLDLEALDSEISAAQEAAAEERLKARLVELTRERADLAVLIQAAEQDLHAKAERFQKQLGPRWQPPVLSADVRQAIEEAVRQGHAQRERIIQQKGADAAKSHAEEIPYPERPWYKEVLSYTTADGLNMWQSTPIAHETEPCTREKSCSVPAVATLTYEAPRHSWKQTACEGHGAGWVNDHILRHIRLAPR